VRRLTLLIVTAVIVTACGGETTGTTTSTSTTVQSSSTTAGSTTTSPTSTTVPTTTTTTTPPDSTDSTEPVTVEPDYLMSLEGFVAFGVLGDDAETVIDGFASAFGVPTADSGWLDAADHGCDFEGPMRTITWIEPGVRLTFVDGESAFGDGPHLAHYSTVLPVDPPWEMEGIRREMRVDEVIDLFPDAEITDGAPLDSLRFVPDVASYAWIDAADQVREFWGGTDYCMG
jgi:hypothetical protein